MPFPVYCPHCRNPLMVGESTTPYTAGCPTCRSPVPVPAYGAPAEQPFELPPEPAPATPPRHTRPRGSCLPWVAGILLLIVAGTIAFLVMQANDREQADYRRAVDLETLHPMAVKQYEWALEDDRKYGNARNLDAARKTLAKLRTEYADLIARYPRWGKSALKH